MKMHYFFLTEKFSIKKFFFFFFSLKHITPGALGWHLSPIAPSAGAVLGWGCRGSLRSRTRPSRAAASPALRRSAPDLIPAAGSGSRALRRGLRPRKLGARVTESPAPAQVPPVLHTGKRQKSQTHPNVPCPLAGNPARLGMRTRG